MLDPDNYAATPIWRRCATDNLIPILLAVWALAMGNQSAAVRQLNVGGIFTTAATATVIFLAGDWANGKPLTSRRLASPSSCAALRSRVPARRHGRGRRDSRQGLPGSRQAGKKPLAP